MHLNGLEIWKFNQICVILINILKSYSRIYALENRLLFFCLLFLLQKPFIVCIWSLALGKGLQMVNQLLVNLGGARPEALTSGRGAWPPRGSWARWPLVLWERQPSQEVPTWLACRGWSGGHHVQEVALQEGTEMGDLCGQNPGRADPERSGSGPSPGPWWHPVLVPLVWGRLGPQGRGGCCRCAGPASSEAAGPAHGRSGVGSPPGAHRGLESKPTERWVLETRPPVADHFLRWVE